MQDFDVVVVLSHFGLSKAIVDVKVLLQNCKQVVCRIGQDAGGL